MHKIFVYGSLRRGGLLNDALRESTLLHENVFTKPEFSLYSLGAFPALVAKGQTKVLGEVYLVSNSVLADLDRIEGHPHFYIRTSIVLDDGLAVESYLLPHVPYGCALVGSGDWIDYFKTK